MHKHIHHIICWKALFLLTFLSTAFTASANDDFFDGGNPIWEHHYLNLSHKIPTNQGWFERKNGEIVIINGSSIYLFDGLKLQQIKSLGDSTVYSIAESSSGTFYYTSIGNLSSIDPNQTETDLTPYFDCPLPHTASNLFISSKDEDTLFLQTKHEVYYLKGKNGKQIYTTRNTLLSAFFSNGSFYIVDSGKGLLRLSPEANTVEQTILETDALFDVTHSITLKNGQAILATSRSELFLFDEQTLSPIPVKWDDGIVAPTILKLAVSGENIAVLTDDNSIRIFDLKGNNVERISCANVNNATPESIITDHQGGIWANTSNQISRVQTQSHLREYAYQSNLPPSIDSICLYDNSIYVGTENGIYTLDHNQRSFHQETPGYREQLQVAKMNDWLIYSSVDGVMIENSKGTLILPIEEHIQKIFPSIRKENTFYCIGVNSITGYSYKNENWSKVLYAEIPQGYYSYVLEDANNNYWVGPSFGNTVKIHVLDDGTTETKTPTLEAFDKTQIYPILLRNEIYFLGRNGSANWDETKQSLMLQPAYSQLLPFPTESISNIFPDNLDRWWVQTDKVIGYLYDNGSYIQWEKAPLSNLLPINIKSIYSSSNDRTFIVTNDKIILCDLRKKLIHKDNQLNILGISLENKHSANVVHTGSLKDEQLAIDLNGRDLKFTFILDNKIRSDLNRYHFKMEGVSEQWSPWIDSTRVSFYKLYPGEYRLLIEGKDYDGNVSQAESPQIIIRPPWYLSKWAYGLYILLTIACLFFIMSLRIRYVARRTNDLRIIIEQKTSEISKRNDTLAETIDQLNKINKQLKITNSEKDELLAIVSHDLKNPLSAIINLSNLLQSDLDDLVKSEIREYSSEIEDSAEMMYQIIRNLLDLNRLDQGLINIKLSPCRLDDMVRDLIEHNVNKAKRKQIKLHLTPPDQEMICLGEGILIKQVIENLLSNAIKYSPKGSNVYISVYERKNRIICDVKDEGPGIKPEERHMLFERFARLSAQPTAGEHSTGLGLAIVKRLTEAMKGRVSCISLPNDGSTFRVSFLKANAMNLAKANKHRQQQL